MFASERELGRARAPRRRELPNDIDEPREEPVNAIVRAARDKQCPSQASAGQCLDSVMHRLSEHSCYLEVLAICPIVNEVNIDECIGYYTGINC